MEYATHLKPQTILTIYTLISKKTGDSDNEEYHVRQPKAHSVMWSRINITWKCVSTSHENAYSFHVEAFTCEWPVDEEACHVETTWCRSAREKRMSYESHAHVVSHTFEIRIDIWSLTTRTSVPCAGDTYTYYMNSACCTYRPQQRVCGSRTLSLSLSHTHTHTQM